MSIERPSLWPQVLSCVATLLGGFVLAPLALVLALGSPEEAVYALREGGMLPFGVGLLVSLVLAVLVPIAATRQLPIAVLVGLTLLPWLTGCVMALVAASGLARAANFEPSMRAMMVAQGVSGYVQGHFVGALTSCAVGAAVLGGLGWATFAFPGARERRDGAALGIGLVGVLVFVAALTMGAAVAVGLSVQLTVFTTAVILAALGPVLIGSIGASINARRPQELGVATALFASVLITCAAAANSSAALNEGFRALASVDAESRLMIAEILAEECWKVFLLGVGAAALSALIPAAAALRAHRSGALARGSYVGGAIAAAVLLAMLAFHIGTSLAARTMAPDVDDFPVALVLTP